MADRYDLKRFEEAQAGVYARVCEELRRGEKRSHWMWFIFPQIRGLGRSAMAERFAIGSLEEARAYLGHGVLGVRLRECTELVNAVEGKTVGEIFGFPDHLKFHSSMTLFARAGQGLKPLSGRGGDVAAEVAIHEDDLGESVFEAALRKYFGGMMDTSTVVRI